MRQSDKKMLPLGLRENNGYYVFCSYYFDYKLLKHQYIFHQARQPNVMWLGSIASGKTFGTTLSLGTDCLTLPRFKALTTSLTTVQAEIQFNTFVTLVQDNKRLEPLIKDIKNRPYPTINFENGSTWTFRTIGYEAKNIRGLEFDRANLDEAAFELSAETVPTLRGRLRGIRLPAKLGRPAVPRMARLDLTSSPADTSWFKDMWKRGEAGNLEYDPDRFLSIRTTIYDNTSLPPDQIELLKAGMSDEQARVELMAQWPDYGDSVYPVRFIEAAESTELVSDIDEAINPISEAGILLPPRPGYRLDVHPRHGITRYEVPAHSDRRYIAACDPGMGDPPRRNSGVVMCFDTSKWPYTMVYFDWVYGRGSILPVIQSFKYCLEKYNPIYKGIDATGPGAAIDELAFENVGITTDSLNFGRDKQGMLNALSVAFTNQQFRFPVIWGLHRQLASYKLEDKNLAQDTVMTLAQVAFLCRLVPRPDRAAPPVVMPIVRLGVRGVGGRQASVKRR